MAGLAIPKVVAVAGDPGGAAALAPVIELLRAEGRLGVRGLAYREARALWGGRGLTFEEVPEETTSPMVAEELLGPDIALLLAATSVNEVELEKRFVAASRRIGLPSLVLLDFWSNYARRFGDAGGNLAYLPDRIAIMDERARDEMVAEGFDPARLVVTGQPAFDGLAAWKLQFIQQWRRALRSRLGVGPGDLLVMFASQPLSALYGEGVTKPTHPGYDERTVLAALVAALDRIADRRGREIVLALRPHPREQAEAFAATRAYTLRVLVSTEGDSRDLALAADLVVGMSTVLLVEACYLGCIVVSLQPGLRVPDPLPTNRLGLSRAVYRGEEIEPALEDMLLDQGARRAARARLSGFRPDGVAAKRVAGLVYQMVGLDSGAPDDGPEGKL